MQPPKHQSSRPGPRSQRDGLRLAAGADVRLRALQALLAIEGGQGSQAALRAVLDQPPALQGPDRGLATELVYGTLRLCEPLDRWITPQCTQGLTGLEPAVVWALRLGALQLTLGRVPAYAAVDTTLDALRAHRGPGRGPLGFVHAVLRKLATRMEQGDGPTGPVVPDWLARRVRLRAAELGVDGEAWLHALAEPAPLHLHVPGPNPEQVLQTLDPACLGERLPVPGTAVATAAIFASEAFARREVVLQDVASAAVARLIAVAPGEPVLDVAAGRGIKSLALAAGGAAVTALDLSEAKLAAAQSLLATAGHALQTVVADAARPLPTPADHYAAVLVDAPCTALGTVRRRPEVRLRRQAADLQRMAELQRQMLRHAAKCVRPGGQLVYAVCSFAQEEGPDVIADFLRQHPQFHREPMPAWLAGVVTVDGDLASHPLWHGADAFYAANLRRQPQDT
jgi:16S rRNA (cytosine967-C5)-methyltransferase